MQDSEFTQSLRSYTETALPVFTDELQRLVRIPSISPGGKHQQECRQVLSEMNAILQPYGFETKILETSGTPAFLAEMRSDERAPWLMIYNHMDVQPADEPQWVTEPFEPIVRDGKIIGRGSTDDKGPALTAIHAINFLRQNGLPMPNIQVVYETEEEIGSPNFGEFLDNHQNLLRKPDSILVSDTIFEGDNPAITYKLKGMLQVEVELETGSKDLHSGVFGNGAKNPLNLLSIALSNCVNTEGRSTIPGFLDGVKEPQGQELEDLRKVAENFDLEGFLEAGNHPQLYTQDPLEILLGLWHRPSFEIHGFEGAQSQPGSFKSALPYKVKAKVSMRLVPGQDPKDIKNKLETHLQSFVPEIQVHQLNVLNATITDLDTPFISQAIQACENGFGKPPVFVGCGGSIGAIPEVQRVFPKAPVILLAQSLISDGYHAPNEEFRLDQAGRGIQTMAHYIRSLAGLRNS